MRVLLDTNVLVSAFAARGLCADLLRFALLEHDLIVAEVVLAELRRNLRDKVRLPASTITAIDTFLRERSVIPKPRKHLSLGTRDRDDEWVVASAVEGRADVLVTGDLDLLEFADPPLRILSPRGFWDLVRGSSRSG